MTDSFDPWLLGALSADVAALTRAPAEVLQRQQRRRLVDLLKAAQAGSPLCRAMMGGVDPERVSLQDLPVMHKQHMMARFDEWVTDPRIKLDEVQAFVRTPSLIGQAYRGQYTVWESSGSSGQPGIFVQDLRSMAAYDAMELLRRPWLRPVQKLLNPWGWGERIVFVGATGGHFASTVSVARLRRLNPALNCGVRELSFLQPMADLVEQLNSWQPMVLTTYPSVAVLLAEQRLAGRLTCSPQEIWTGGECLTAPMRRLIREAFGCPISNSYGASECLTLAFECREGHLHLNSDWAILEPVDRHHRPVAPGEMGATTLLTNLANHVQPIIRYDLGDQVAVHPTPCACGSALPVIEVQGRCDDLLRLPGARHAEVSVAPLALSTVLEEDAGLYDFQLVQLAPAELLLRVGQGGQDGENAARRGRDVLKSYLRDQGACGVSIQCHCGEAGRPERSGKTRRVIAIPAP